MTTKASMIIIVITTTLRSGSVSARINGVFYAANVSERGLRSNPSINAINLNMAS